MRRDLFVCPLMCIEELIRLLCTQQKNPALEILLLKFCHLLIHHQSLSKVFKFSFTFSFDLSVNLNKDFQIPSHHIS